MGSGLDPSIVGGSSPQIISTHEKYKAMFAAGGNDSLDQDDFMTLMVEQLKNQDFQNPTDNTQFIAQMAQFSALQSQQQMTYYTQASYASSLVGKNAVVATTSAEGKYATDFGVITAVSLTNNDFLYTVNGKQYSYQNIMQIVAPLVEGGSTDIIDAVSASGAVDLSKKLEDELSIPELNTDPRYEMGFTKGGQKANIVLKFASAEEDSVISYSPESRFSYLTIGLKDFDDIRDMEALVERVNAAISKEMSEPANLDEPMMTKENFTAGSFYSDIDLKDITLKDGTALTPEQVETIIGAGVRTIVENPVGVTLWK